MFTIYLDWLQLGADDGEGDDVGEEHCDALVSLADLLIGLPLGELVGHLLGQHLADQIV